MLIKIHNEEMLYDLADPESLLAVPACKGEDLSALPHLQVPGTDIFMIARCVIERKENAETSFKVTDRLLPFFGLERDALMKKAMENTCRNMVFEFEPLSSRLGKMLAAGSGIDGLLPGEPASGLWILTNTDTMFGAAAILSEEILHALFLSVGEPYYIIPSSIHELLALGCSCCSSPEDEAMLQQMISSVNLSEVSEQDRLSDSLFFYDGETVGTVPV